MTSAQWAAIDEMGHKHHVVLVDPADLPGAVKLTPADFCNECGGDGIDPASYDKPEFDDCSRCDGRGGIPVTKPPTIILPDGGVA